MRFCRRATASLLLLPLLATSGHASAVEEAPVFIDADHISGRSDIEIVAEGNVQLRKENTILTTNRLTYRETTDEVDAIGDVRLSQDEDLITGPRLHLKLTENIGTFEEPHYSIKRAAPGAAPSQLTVGSGEAKRLDFEGKSHYRLTDATYSTCGPGAPDWFARASNIQLDYETEVGTAHDTTVLFKGVPLLYSPWLTFPLNNKRKSGLLAPTIGTTSKSGFEFTVPYYWNIAPNLDATLAPRVMTKRGLALNTEFRYLDHNYNGILQGDYLPRDKIEHRRRSSYSLLHNQNFGLGFTGHLNFNGVSDDRYFSDMSSRMANIAQNNLLRQGNFGYASTWWNIGVMAQSFQTLQDPALPPVATPYRRLPQITLNAARADVPLGVGTGLFTLQGEFVKFAHPTQVEGVRNTIYPQLALPLQTAAFHMTPRLGLHSTTYHIEHPQTGVADERITRNVPLFSLDGGMALERPLDLAGHTHIQTLEPRFYYLRVPDRDQSRIPIFDSGIADFNFAQIFSDNRYSGGDRIGDANQLTVALSSRLIDPSNGAERLRAAIGQRYHFKSQTVTLPGERPRNTNTADILAALSGQLTSSTMVDAGLQYNPDSKQFDRLAIGGRYQPKPNRVLSASYRYNRDHTGVTNDVKQIDIAGQWPLLRGWSGVARYNYSLADHRIIESLGGLEYNAGCWASRVVLQRIATATGDSSTAFFIQLELNGFSSIGSNPLDLLKRSIPGYGRVTQPAADPVFGAN